MQKAIVTVLGNDRTGIIAGVTTKLSEAGINVLDITQTIMQDNIFVMLMLVDMEKATVSFHEAIEKLNLLGEALHVSIRIQREEIFDAMHKI